LQILLHALVTRFLLIDVNDFDEERGPSSSCVGSESQQSGALEVMTDIAVTDSMGTAATDDKARIIQEAAHGAAKSDWRVLAVVIDRFFFIVFAVIIIATCLGFTGYL